MGRWVRFSLALFLGIMLLNGCFKQGVEVAPYPTGELPAGSLLDDQAVGTGPNAAYLGTGLVAMTSIPDGYRLSLQGSVRPYVRMEDTILVVDLPGAHLFADLRLPPGVTAERVEPESVIDPLAGTNGLNATLPTRMPAGGVRLTFPAPEAPYAFYRHDRETIDLRIQVPGLAGKRIVIDPGHGSEETGAIGPGGYPEKVLNLEVARLLEPKLTAAGAEVIMTRTEDVRAVPASAAALSGTSLLRADLGERANISNRVGADLFLSIHANGGTEGLRGIETFWTVRNLNANRSQHFADLIQRELLQAYGFTDRGVKQRAFNVIRNAEAPAALAELGFLTDPKEAAVLMSAEGQEQAARALFQAIERFFGG